MYFVKSEEQFNNHKGIENFVPIKILDENQYTKIIDDLEKLEFCESVPIFAASDPNFDMFDFIIKIEYCSGINQIVTNVGMNYTYIGSDVIDSYHGSVDDKVWRDLIIIYTGQELFDSCNSIT